MASFLQREFARTGRTAHQRAVVGLDEALRNLKREIKGVKGRTIGGLLAGGLIIQRAAQKGVPVETGNLRGSAYTQKARQNAEAVEIGFTAAYAVYVHENTEMVLKGQPRPSGLGEYWGPSGRAKFLELAAREKTDEVVATVAAHARVKG